MPTPEELEAIQQAREVRVELKREYRQKIQEVHEEFREKMKEIAPSKGRRGTKPVVRI